MSVISMERELAQSECATVRIRLGVGGLARSEGLYVWDFMGCRHLLNIENRACHASYFLGGGAATPLLE
ncbi:hypothetical protein D3C84_938250 [compost metagenome]